MLVPYGFRNNFFGNVRLLEFSSWLVAMFSGRMILFWKNVSELKVLQGTIVPNKWLEEPLKVTAQRDLYFNDTVGVLVVSSLVKRDFVLHKFNHHFLLEPSRFDGIFGQGAQGRKGVLFSMQFWELSLCCVFFDDRQPAWKLPFQYSSPS